MSQRRNKLLAIYLEKGKGILSEVEVKKLAEACRAKLNYIRKMKNNYFINAYIGVSQHNIRCCNPLYKNCKKVGRKKLVYEAKKSKYAKSKMLEPWHLHIIIEANPGETVGNILVDYLNKKLGKLGIVAVKRNVLNKDRKFAYAMRQSIRSVFVVENRVNSSLEYDFKKLNEYYKKEFKYKPKFSLEKNSGKKWFKANNKAVF